MSRSSRNNAHNLAALPPSADRDIVMGPPALPSQVTLSTSGDSRARETDDIAEKYNRLKRKYFELADRNKEVEIELRASGERALRMRSEQSLLLERITELEAATLPPHAFPPHPMHPLSSAWPRSFLQQPGAHKRFIANLDRAVMELEHEDHSVDPILRSKHVGPHIRKRMEAEMKERHEEELRDARRMARRPRGRGLGKEKEVPATSAHTRVPLMTHMDTGRDIHRSEREASRLEREREGTSLPANIAPPAGSQRDSRSAPSPASTIVLAGNNGPRLRIKPPVPPGAQDHTPERSPPPPPSPQNHHHRHRDHEHHDHPHAHHNHNHHHHHQEQQQEMDSHRQRDMDVQREQQAIERERERTAALQREKEREEIERERDRERQRELEERERHKERERERQRERERALELERDAREREAERNRIIEIERAREREHRLAMEEEKAERERHLQEQHRPESPAPMEPMQVSPVSPVAPPHTSAHNTSTRPMPPASPPTDDRFVHVNPGPQKNPGQGIIDLSRTRHYRYEQPEPYEADEEHRRGQPHEGGVHWTRWQLPPGTVTVGPPPPTTQQGPYRYPPVDPHDPRRYDGGRGDAGPPMIHSAYSPSTPQTYEYSNQPMQQQIILGNGYMQTPMPMMHSGMMAGPSGGGSRAKPKRLKAHTVQSKSFSIPMVPRDKQGRPLLPLNVGIMTVHNLGDVCMREHFHTERYIFPVGYEVTRRYLSTVDPNAEVVYRCKIVDGGDGPKFQITAEDQPDKPVIAGTATGAWSVIVRSANHVRNRQHSNSVSGPDFFGLGQNTIKHLIQELPNADRLRDYVWQNFVEGGPLGGRHAAVIPALPDGEQDPDNPEQTVVNANGSSMSVISMTATPSPQPLGPSAPHNEETKELQIIHVETPDNGYSTGPHPMSSIMDRTPMKSITFHQEHPQHDRTEREQHRDRGGSGRGRRASVQSYASEELAADERGHSRHSVHSQHSQQHSQPPQQGHSSHSQSHSRTQSRSHPHSPVVPPQRTASHSPALHREPYSPHHAYHDRSPYVTPTSSAPPVPAPFAGIMNAYNTSPASPQSPYEGAPINGGAPRLRAGER